MPVSNEVKEQLRRSFEVDLGNPSLGDQSWRARNPQQIEEMELARQMLWDAAQVAEAPEVPMPLTRNLEEIIKAFIAHATALLGFKIDINQSNQPRMNQVMDGVSRFLQSFFRPWDSPNERSPAQSFLSLNGTLQRYAIARSSPAQNKIDELERIKTEVEALANQVSSRATEVENRLNTLAATPTAAANERFSTLYSSEAAMNSRFGGTFPWLGEAQIWLYLGLAALGLLLCAILNLPDGKALSNNVKVLPSSESVHPDFWRDGATLLPLIHSVLIISILVYFVRFSFRQFSVRKHLSTVNRAKANLADTLVLFLQSTLVEEKEIRQTIVIESIKGLASTESSGFVDDKSPEINFPIISEPLRAATRG